MAVDSIDNFDDYEKIINAHREKRKLTMSEFGVERNLKKRTTQENHVEKMNPLTGRAMHNRGALKKKILANPWYRKTNPSVEASRWFTQEVLKNSKKYNNKSRILMQGQLHSFEYFEPKNKDKPSLPYFDKYPLVLAFGAYRTKLGIRNIGINFHYLPASVRLIVLNEIYDLYRTVYFNQIKAGIQKPAPVKYQQIINHVKKYGVGFAIKMYIPERVKVCIRYPYDDWDKAIFLRSFGLAGIKGQKMVNEWKKYCRASKFSGNDKISF